MDNKKNPCQNYSVNSHALALEATLTISLNESRLYYKTINREKQNSAFCSVTTYHPSVALLKERLYEQIASNPALTGRNMQKANPYLLHSSLLKICIIYSFLTVFFLQDLTKGVNGANVKGVREVY